MTDQELAQHCNQSQPGDFEKRSRTKSRTGWLLMAAFISVSVLSYFLTP